MTPRVRTCPVDTKETIATDRRSLLQGFVRALARAAAREVAQRSPQTVGNDARFGEKPHAQEE